MAMVMAIISTTVTKRNKHRRRQLKYYRAYLRTYVYIFLCRYVEFHTTYFNILKRRYTIYIGDTLLVLQTGGTMVYFAW